MEFRHDAHNSNTSHEAALWLLGLHDQASPRRRGRVAVTSMIPVRIVGLQLDASTGASVVLLGESEAPVRVLPILIGPTEAQSIALAAAGFITPRPLTHDLMVAVIESTGSTLAEVAVTELVDGTFFAELVIDTPAGRQRVSSRPSDGIALAMRVDAPIVVASDVLDDASVPVQRDSDEPFSDDEIDTIVADFERALDNVDPSDFQAPDDEGETPK